MLSSTMSICNRIQFLRHNATAIVGIMTVCLLLFISGCSDNNYYGDITSALVDFPPNAPIQPIPENGATNQSPHADLSWSSYDINENPSTYDVYFGIVPDPPYDTTVAQAYRNYYNLNFATEYYWKVVAHDGRGHSITGPVWHFKTQSGFNRIGFYYGLLNGRIIVQNNYLYFGGDSSGLKILNVSSPSGPYLISHLEPGIINDFCIDGNYLYLANGDQGLAVIDVTSPPSPAVVGHFSVNGTSNSVAVFGHYVYLAANDTLYVIDVANPATPEAIALYAGPATSTRVISDNQYAYVVFTNVLHRVDISDPGHPVFAGAYGLSGHFSSMALSGDLILLGYDRMGLQIIRFGANNIAEPVGFNNNIYARDLAVEGNYVYIAASYSIEAFDISDPGNPRFSAYAQSNYGECNNIFADTNYIYGSFADTTLAIYQHVR